MKTFLSIDIGTSSSKLTLFDERGRPVASESASYPVEYPRQDWAEQDPAAWWSAVCQLAPAIMQHPQAQHLAAISVSGQTPLCAPVDEEGQPIRKALLWLDRRSVSQVEWLRERLGEETCLRISANRLDSYFGGPKWLWLRQADPDVFSRTWKILQANSYVILKLTGQAVIDPSQAGLCSPCFDFAKQAWDNGICEAMGLPLEILPTIHPAASVIGAVQAEAARLTGLPEGIPVVCGGGDFACSGLGAGVTGQKSAALMLGTAGNLLFPGVFNRDPRLLHTRHLTGEPLTFGGVMAGGNLTWFAGLLGSSEPDLFQRLDQEAAQVPAGSEGLVFLPYLMGERTPVWDPGARGAFVGLSSRHTRAHLFRAVLEGVAYAFRQISEITGANAQVESITAIDGGARSPLWRSILASVLGLPILQGSSGAGTAVGSAFLAALGVGAASSFEAIQDWTETVSQVFPDPAAARIYDNAFTVYQGLYPKLKSDFAVLHPSL